MRRGRLDRPLLDPKEAKKRLSRMSALALDMCGAYAEVQEMRTELRKTERELRRYIVHYERGNKQ